MGNKAAANTLESPNAASEMLDVPIVLPACLSGALDRSLSQSNGVPPKGQLATIHSIGILACVPVVTAAFGVLVAGIALPRSFMLDFYGFWAAGRLALVRGNLYDPALYTLIETPAGWDPQAFGAPVMLIRFYPPWIGLILAPFALLDHTTAQAWWLTANVVMGILCVGLLVDTFRWPRQTQPSAWTLVLLCPFLIMSLVLGQGSVLELLILSMVARFFVRRQPVAGGAALAVALTRPQVAWSVVLLCLIWLLSRRQWRGIVAFAGTTLLLVGVSFAVWPSWPMQLGQGIVLQGLSATDRPWINPTVYALVATFFGVGMWSTYVAWGLVASAAILVCGWKVGRTKKTPLYPVLVGLALAFIAGPYVRPYDLTLMLIPALLLLRVRAETRLGAWVFVGVSLLIVYAQELLLSLLGGAIAYQVSFLWIVLVPLAATRVLGQIAVSPDTEQGLD